jgi:hypothetical protein
MSQISACEANDLMDIEAIFIIGVQHSGTSILYNMLASHPHVAWFSQYSQRDGSVPGRARVPFYNTINKTLRNCIKHDWRKKRQYFRPQPREKNKIWDFITSAGSSGELVVRLRGLIEKECRDWDRQVILVKFLPLCREVGLFRAAFPKAKFIHILRDGRAVALSIRHKFQKGGIGRLDALGRAARHWEEIIGIIDREKPEMDCVELKYESLCEASRETVGDLLAFAGLRKDVFPFNKCPARLSATNQSWFDRASDEEMLLLEHMLGDEVRKRGYGAVSGGRPRAAQG